MDNEIPISGIGWRCRDAMPRIAERDRDEQGDDDLCEVNKPRSCARADQYTAASTDIEGSAYLKGKSSHRLLTEYKALHKRYWGQHLWSRGYWVASSENVTDEVCKEYIKDQKPPKQVMILPLYDGNRPNGRSIRLSAVT